jgi:hypothetical protein
MLIIVPLFKIKQTNLEFSKTYLPTFYSSWIVSYAFFSTQAMRRGKKSKKVLFVTD